MERLVSEIDTSNTIMIKFDISVSQKKVNIYLFEMCVNSKLYFLFHKLFLMSVNLFIRVIFAIKIQDFVFSWNYLLKILLIDLNSSTIRRRISWASRICAYFSFWTYKKNLRGCPGGSVGGSVSWNLARNDQHRT
jgi:hypothetical protein